MLGGSDHQRAAAAPAAAAIAAAAGAVGPPSQRYNQSAGSSQPADPLGGQAPLAAVHAAAVQCGLHGGPAAFPGQTPQPSCCDSVVSYSNSVVWGDHSPGSVLKVRVLGGARGGGGGGTNSTQVQVACLVWHIRKPKQSKQQLLEQQARLILLPDK
jgi:hypothetical protein